MSCSQVTIVTELSYKANLKKATLNLLAGVMRFHPSGRDTMSKVSLKVIQTTINLKVSALQMNAMWKIFLPPMWDRECHCQ